MLFANYPKVKLSRLTCKFQILGLEVCADTFVGDEMVRGISGGQRKRLTTGSNMNIFIVKH